MGPWKVMMILEPVPVRSECLLIPLTLSLCRSITMDMVRV